MSVSVFKIEGMSCSHCVAAVNNAVGDLEGVTTVTVSLENKSATVDYDPAIVTVNAITAAVEDEGFEVIGIDEASL